MIESADQWDGSISDAFSRVHTTIPKNKAGIDNILKDAEDRHWEPRPRIKVAAVKGPAGRLGLQKGDVVTHFDGEPFIGSAVDLAHIIDELYKESPDATFQFVVNADESTAQVLKLRAEKCRKAMADVASLS
jgi:S1-C subfamily serine protease